MVFQYAAAHHVPDMEELGYLSHLGGLLAYGADQDDEFDRAADLADQSYAARSRAICPLELPTRYHFTVDLKAAATEVWSTRTTLERSDDVIE